MRKELSSSYFWHGWAHNPEILILPRHPWLPSTQTFPLLFYDQVSSQEKPGLLLSVDSVKVAVSGGGYTSPIV